MGKKLDSVKINLNSEKIEAPARGNYHHGDLRGALINAAEDILAERGVEGFSLREAARRAGVSPAAPAHHFGDARGLLTAVATRGFERLETALTEAQQELRDPRARLRAQGHAYVRFATANPAHFNLMWRRALLDNDDAHLQEAGRAAFALLDEAAADLSAAPKNAPSPGALAAWSIVHGYARLILDGALGDAPPELLDQVLDRLTLLQPHSA
jgi:AcrR family transcriptional regulator